ncbi:hypothetical protein Tco_0276301 [Tanacetum coccineum]
MKEWHEQADLARTSLDKAAKKMKKWANEKRRHIEFEVGDQVMVKLLPQQFKSLRKVHKGLIQRYEGPFPMIGCVGKAYHRDEEDPERGMSKRVPTAVVTSYDREVKDILSDQEEAIGLENKKIVHAEAEAEAKTMIYCPPESAVAVAESATVVTRI